MNWLDHFPIVMIVVFASYWVIVQVIFRLLMNWYSRKRDDKGNPLPKKSYEWKAMAYSHLWFGMPIWWVASGIVWIILKIGSFVQRLLYHTVDTVLPPAPPPEPPKPKSLCIKGPNGKCRVTKDKDGRTTIW